MIDKLDVRIPRRTQFRSEFFPVYTHASKNGLLRPSRYYSSVGDFRTYDYPARLHMYAVFGRKRESKHSHDHKLELYDTGEMKFDQMIHEIGTLHHTSPRL